MSVEEKQVADVSADPAMQQLLMRFAGTLSRRRAYAPSHPMVQGAEDQLFESIGAQLQQGQMLVIGVAKTDLIINGEPYTARGSFARELATRLHKRGVGALTMIQGTTVEQLRDLMTWLAREHTTPEAFAKDAPPALPSINVSMVAYDQLVLGSHRDASSASAEKLWRSLAALATETQVAGARVAGILDAEPSENAELDRDKVIASLREKIQNPIVAQRTAVALMEMASEGSSARGETRSMIGQQLHGALLELGEGSFADIIKGLGKRSLQQRFVSQVVDVLPVATVVTWLQSAAKAEEQQLSHQLLRLMGKLSTVAEVEQTPQSEEAFRGAAKELVSGWTLEDSNPADHAALLDRIALAERLSKSQIMTHTSIVESSRLVQMALELDYAGEDALAGAEAMVDAGAVGDLMLWANQAGQTAAARQIRDVATSAKAVKQLLLTEPVDRLQARTMLESLGTESCDVLIDVLEAADSRNTRMLVRQRLSEFGAEIRPQLLARLGQAPWYLVRNILTLLNESARSGANGAGDDFLEGLLDHPQVQVRMEALRILTHDPRKRESALKRALEDRDEKLVVVALQSLTEAVDGQLPPPLTTPIMATLVSMVDNEQHSDATRARMVRAMSSMKHNEVRDWLIRLSTRKTRILRRMTLAEPTRVAVTAIHALQRVYGSDPVAAPVLGLLQKVLQDPRWHAHDPSVAERG